LFKTQGGPIGRNGKGKSQRGQGKLDRLGQEKRLGKKEKGKGFGAVKTDQFSTKRRGLLKKRKTHKKKDRRTKGGGFSSASKDGVFKESSEIRVRKKPGRGEKVDRGRGEVGNKTVEGNQQREDEARRCENETPRGNIKKWEIKGGFNHGKTGKEKKKI